MKNIQWVLSLFAFMLLSLRVSANEPTKHKLAEELIGILQLSNAVSSHVEQLKETMPELMKNMKLTNYSDTVCSNLNNTASLMTEILNWYLMKEDYIRLYS